MAAQNYGGRSSGGVAFKLDKKSWSELYEHVESWICDTVGLDDGCLAHTLQWSLPNCETKALRLYALGPSTSSEREHTILYADIPYILPDNHSTDANKLPSQTSLKFAWKRLLSNDCFVQRHLFDLTKEEILIRERQRVMHIGIRTYQAFVTPHCTQFLFSAAKSIHIADDRFDVGIGLSSVNILPFPVFSLMCPARQDLIAHVCGSNIVLTLRGTSFEVRPNGARTNDCIKLGTPAFVIQEEFDRCQGIWWQPTTTQTAQNVHYLLIEETDDSMVPELVVSPPNVSSELCDMMKYPRAGEMNAKSTVKLLKIIDDGTSFDCTVLSLKHELDELFPWAEYLVRTGWLPAGDAVWVQLLSRDQKRTVVVHIPLGYFVPAVTRESISTMETIHTESTMECDPQVESVQNDALGNGYDVVSVLVEESSQHWITVFKGPVFLTEAFLPSGIRNDKSSDDSFVFLWCSERSGFAHIYFTVTSFEVGDMLSPNKIRVPKVVQEPRAITAGDWQINASGSLYIDMEKSLVYFTAFCDSPLEMHVYVAPIGPIDSFDRTKPPRLTTLGQSLTQQRSDDVIVSDRFMLANGVEACFLVALLSSLSSPLKCCVFLLQFSATIPNSSLYGAIGLRQLVTEYPPLPATCSDLSVNLVTTTESLKPSCPNSNSSLEGYRTIPSDHQLVSTESDKHASLAGSMPEIYTYHSQKSNQIHYAMLFRPANYEKELRYPCILYVYAGPEIQVVKNVYMQRSGFEKYTNLGYAVCMVDGRGSANRGIEFAAHLKNALGTVEIDDQIEGLYYVAAESGVIDVSRVAVKGWSYGGYMALMCLAQRPDIFSAAIAGAPVTCWRYYDTGYTERYMGILPENEEFYRRSSVLELAHKFPSQPEKLLILHGLIDENVHFIHTSMLISKLQRHKKPYQLQVFPSERHAMRSYHAHTHSDVTVLQFLQNNL